ncbi:MAG: hypothetical protein VXZ83_00015 [Verrucomicrobiota bacterium]|nr:hypothetical protein [Verrucomicrobiota bacterium]
MIFNTTVALNAELADLGHKACKLVFCAIFFSGITGALVANSQSQAEEGFEYTFNVIYLDYGKKSSSDFEILGVNLSFFDEGKQFSIAAEAGAMSRTFKYKGSQDLVFYRELDGADGEKEYRPLVTAKMGKPGRKILIVSKSPKGRMYARTFDIGSIDFKSGSLRVVNLSQQEALVRIGEITQKIKPMGTYNFRLKGERVRFLVRFAIAAIQEGQPKLIEDKRYAVNKDRRELIILHQDTTNLNKISYTSFLVGDDEEVENSSDDKIGSLDISDFFGEDSGGGEE